MTSEVVIDASDPYEREAQTFPHLSEEMAARVATYGVETSLAAGERVFERGDRGVDFFLVIEGAIEIIEFDAHNEPHVITVHSDRQFTGEMDLFNNRRILVSGRAQKDSRVARIERAQFRRLVAAEPDIGEIIMRAFILRRVGFIRHAQGGVIVIGASHSGDTLRLRRFLTRNGYPHRLLDVDHDEDAAGFLECFELTADQLPVVIAPDREVLRNPSNAMLADAIGLTEDFDDSIVYDLAVVGAGPAGLASAVYAASEGLSTIVIEGMAPGGQAGTSSKIENYLGFPTGISGQALAGRAQAQAQKFGARLAVSRMVTRLDCDSAPYHLQLDGGDPEHPTRVAARAIVIATGARYRKLDVTDYERFEGSGIHYAATAMEATLCSGEQVIVVGGGNSAGQAAVYLSRTVEHVHVLVRAEGPGRDHVRLPRPAHRVVGPHHAARRDRDHRAARRALPARSDVDRSCERSERDPSDRERVRDDRRRTQHRVARRLSLARQARLRAHRCRSRAAHRDVTIRDQSRRGVRGRRRTFGIHQARRVGRGRRIGGGAGDPSMAQSVDLGVVRVKVESGW